MPSWFVKVETLKERLLANNAQTSWVPAYVKEKRFHNWLENAHDWAVSRSRFWGTPLPVWSSEDGDEVVVIGSQAELQELSGVQVCPDSRVSKHSTTAGIPYFAWQSESALARHWLMLQTVCINILAHLIEK